jgi:hypothetical protein
LNQIGLHLPQRLRRPRTEAGRSAGRRKQRRRHSEVEALFRRALHRKSRPENFAPQPDRFAAASIRPGFLPQRDQSA